MEEVPTWMKIPAELEFKCSEAENTKIGVWSKCAIDKDEKYGPFVGEKKKLSAVLDDTYSWEIRGPKGRRLFSIDASDPSKGNWMRYVKSARYFEEQNMIAVQEEKNIFYKTLRMIPKGEELLCWYKGEKPLSKDEVMPPTKVEGSKNGITGNGDSVKPSNPPKTDNTNETKCPKEKIDGAKVISVTTTGGSASKDDTVEGACIRLTGLTNSIQRMITSTSSDVEIRSREPVVRLVPLSAEIKLKVHLDLDIHLDTELKTKLEAKKEEQIEKTETRTSGFKRVIKSEKSSEFEANAVVTYGSMSDYSKEASLSSLPVPSLKDEKDTIISKVKGESKENRECKSDILTSSQVEEDKVTIDPSIPVTVVKPSLKETESVLKADLSLSKNETKPSASESKSALNSNLKISHSKIKADPNLPESNVNMEVHESKPQMSPSSSLTTEATAKVDTTSSERTDKSERDVSESISEANSNVEDASCSSDAIKASDTTNVGDALVKTDANFPETAATNGACSSDTKVEIDTCSTGTDEKCRRGSKVEEQVEKVGEMKESMCLKGEETVDAVSQDLSDSVDVKIKIPSQEHTGDSDVASENETVFKMEINAEEIYPDANKNTVDIPSAAVDRPEPPKEKSISVAGRKFPMMKNLKRKKCRCHQCGRKFRKPFQLKMHIIRAHEKRERKFRGYKISKRETIRTRSVAYLETATNEAIEQSVSTETTESKAVKNEKENTTSQQVDSNREMEKITIKDEPAPASDRDCYPKTTPSAGDYSQDTTIVEKEMFECQRCRRTFQYQSWLDRHMVVHEKDDSMEKIPTVQNTQNTERKLTQDLVKVAPKPIDQPRQSNFLNEFHVPKFKQSNFSEEQSKPFSCEVCGKMFTTKKNTRRHKRLIHNILVRPDRTKLHYANYTVERSKRVPPLKIPKKINLHTKKSAKSAKAMNRPKFGSKAHSPRKGDRNSSGISFRLFNPSQLRLPDQPTVPQTKIQWRVASTRTGPPPAVKNIEVDELYRMNIKQEAKFTGVGVSNPWVGVSKPKPYIPKRRKTERAKSPGYAKEKVRESIILSKRSPAKSSSSKMVVKEEPRKTSSSNAPGNVAEKSLAVITQTQLQMSVPNMKRKLQESDVERKDHPRAIAPKRHQQDTFPKSPFKASVSLTHASSPSQVQPLASNVNGPKLLPQSLKLQLGRQPQTLTTASLLELQARIRTLQNELAAAGEDAILQRAKADKLSPTQLSGYACNVCLVSFGSTFALNQHVSIHADSWPYKCELCVQLFRTPQELMQHRKTHHATEQALQCKICNEKFHRIELLEQHKEEMHSSKTIEKPSTESLQPAVQTKTIEKPITKSNQSAVQTCTSYTCTKCSKQFSETSAFHGHIIDCASNGMNM